MCGIVGAVTERNIERVLIDGLKRLEYRGYDSAGLALIDAEKKLKRLRTRGKVRELENSLNQTDIHGTIGIAHTRWATHGAPSELNAHPFISEGLCLVHNGIIENHESLKVFLIEKGYEFTSDTDSETVVHLLHFHLQQTKDLLLATQEAVAQLKGAYALGILSLNSPEQIIGVRHGSPLVLGIGQKENFFASDALALLPLTNKFIYLEEGDIADISKDTIKIYNQTLDLTAKRQVKHIEFNFDISDRGEHRHYMSKEIFEQPDSILLSLEGRASKTYVSDSAFGLEAIEVFARTQHVQLVACGTSYHAALVARYWIETLANIPCSVDIASEFRYKKTIVPPNSLFVTLSQSGETADTLAALRLAKQIGFMSSLAICNVPESSLIRESDLNFMMRAGVEVCVASTKAFTSQLTALLLLALSLGKQHKYLDKNEEKSILTDLHALPQKIRSVLEINKSIEILSQNFGNKEHALFLGRGALYPIALEGALKLKEISYIHAEGYPAGELKHGPLALVDMYMPVIAVAPNNHLLEKLKSNLQEVRARGGELYVFTDIVKTADSGIHIIQMPEINPLLAPIIYTIPLQLLAYHVAVLKGTDVDQPRNLAKSVTVE